MSKLYYDHLVVFEEINLHIKNAAITPEEREELWKIVDETLHHRIMGCVLSHLPEDHHETFLSRFYKKPHDENLIRFLNEKTQKDIQKIIQEEAKNLEKELLKYFEKRGRKAKK